MAVQKSHSSHSRSGMRRAHQALKKPPITIDQTTGETHRRHHISPKGTYRGRQIFEVKSFEE